MGRLQKTLAVLVQTNNVSGTIRLSVHTDNPRENRKEKTKSWRSSFACRHGKREARQSQENLKLTFFLSFAKFSHPLRSLLYFYFIDDVLLCYQKEEILSHRAKIFTSFFVTGNLEAVPAWVANAKVSE